MRLRLHVPTHYPKRPYRRPSLREEAGDYRMEGTLAGAEDISVGTVKRKAVPPVLQ